VTAPATAPIPRPARRVERHRRVKRGIVAGYLHGLSQRHRPEGPGADQAAGTSARNVRR
jgi:hypothetical protein